MAVGEGGGVTLVTLTAVPGWLGLTHGSEVIEENGLDCFYGSEFTGLLSRFTSKYGNHVLEWNYLKLPQGGIANPRMTSLGEVKSLGKRFTLCSRFIKCFIL